MYILSAHPIESTRHVIMFDRSYRRRLSMPVLRRLAGLTLRRCVYELLENNANVVRADWDAFYSLGRYTLVAIRKAAR